MKTTIISKTDDKVILKLEETTPELANSIRKTIISAVPTLAVDKVIFTINSGSLYDEILALRIGLLPLKGDLKTYNFTSECTCKDKGCSKCQVKLTLSKKGPCTVYAGDLKSSDSEIKSAYLEMPIAVLLDGQSLAFTAIARLGIGSEHAKWSPGISFYRYNPSVKITKSGEKLVEAINVCPRGVFEIKDNSLIVANEINCDLSLSCVEKYGADNFVVEGDPNTLIFTIESWGQLPPEKMWSEAVSILEKDLKQFKKELK